MLLKHLKTLLDLDNQWLVMSFRVLYILLLKLCKPNLIHFYVNMLAFSALMLLVGKDHPAYKNWVMRCWCGYLSGVRCRLFAHGPVDAITTPKPHHIAAFKSRLILPFWYRLTHIVLEETMKRVSSSSSILTCWWLTYNKCTSYKLHYNWKLNCFYTCLLCL